MQHPEPHDLTALAYGLIEGDERETLLTHLSECDDCRAIYDSYREEQTTVRDSIVRDARSGAAEAKALESTLRMLGAIDAIDNEAEAEKKGRLFRLPRWVLIAEVAAMLAVAVGLFFILKPGDETDSEVVPIADELKAPAEVSGGVVYVSDHQGEWKPADAVPEDEWVKAGEEGELLLTLANGSQAKIEPNCVFRVGRDGTSQQLMVQFLRGNGVIDTTNMTDNMFVRSGEAGFYAMPEARFEIETVLTATEMRSWTRPDRVDARVVTGDVVLWPEVAEYNKVPLQGGDKVEWTPEDFKVYTQNGKTLPVTYGWHAEDRASHIFETELEGEAGEAYRFLIELAPRLEAFQKRLENMPTKGDQRAEELRKHFYELREFDGERDIQIVMRPHTGINDIVVITLVEEAMTRVLNLQTDGVNVKLNVYGGAVRQSFESESVEDLKANVPADVLELLDGVTFKKDDDGFLRIDEANVEGKEGAKVKVVSSSSRAPRKKD